jgi:hypothetical protein
VVIRIAKARRRLARQAPVERGFYFSFGGGLNRIVERIAAFIRTAWNR